CPQGASPVRREVSPEDSSSPAKRFPSSPNAMRSPASRAAPSLVPVCFRFSASSQPLARAQLDAAGAPRIIRDATMTDQKKTRRQMLEEFVAKKPDDAFSLYGLAMECVNSGDAAAAVTHFPTLLQRHADYIPAYLMYGQLLARESPPTEAKQILSTGIAAAAKKGDQHARSEMEALLTELS